MTKQQPGEDYGGETQRRRSEETWALPVGDGWLRAGAKVFGRYGLEWGHCARRAIAKAVTCCAPISPTTIRN